MSIDELRLNKCRECGVGVMGGEWCSDHDPDLRDQKRQESVRAMANAMNESHQVALLRKQLDDLKPLLFVVDMFERCSENQEQWSGPAQAVFNAVREWRKLNGRD